jgi:hypothetical protein
MKSIRIANQTYMHVYLHDIKFTLEEAISQMEDSSNFTLDFTESAKALIDSMEDHWCVSLLEALKKECETRIYQHWEEYAPENNKKTKNNG